MGELTMWAFTKERREATVRFVASLTLGIWTRTDSGVRSGSMDDAEGETHQKGMEAFTVKFPYCRV